MNNSSFDQKVAVVTGASSGLGKAVTELLSNAGVKVFALSRNIEKSTFPDKVVKVPLNIQNITSIDEAFTIIDNTTDKIDILVNCAGRGLIKSLENSTRDEIADVLDVNLKGNIYVAQAVYTRMIPHKSGHIINVVSTSGIKARVDEPIYCASKWGLRGFTESLRMAAVDHMIRVTGVYPGGMQTDFWKGGEPRDTSKFMKASDIASEIFHILSSPITVAPSEYIIERGFGEK